MLRGCVLNNVPVFPIRVVLVENLTSELHKLFIFCSHTLIVVSQYFPEVYVFVTVHCCFLIFQKSMFCRFNLVV